MNHDSNPFELYQSMPGWKEASIDIEAVAKGAKKKVLMGVDPNVAYKDLDVVLRKYRDLGAEDSEPIWHATKLFCAGTVLDPSDFA